MRITGQIESFLEIRRSLLLFALPQENLCTVTQGSGKAVGEVLPALLLDQTGADGDGLVVIRDRRGELAQLLKGVAAVVQAHGEDVGQVLPALLLDQTGVDGDGLVVIRDRLGELA